MNSSPSKHQEPTLPPAAHSVSTATAGTKRPAPSLLPPFEPLSSSPGLPRPAKRQATGKNNSSTAYLKYPTPIPTSSTGILSSSPPRASSSTFARTQSSLSERAPLSAVPTIVLNGNGETLLMGRSSNSSNYQLSANRLISRVHVKARYVPAASPLEPNKIEIVCNGWNGLKLHCQGRTYELWKGDSFTSETEGTEMMLDVQDARVMVQWPKSVCSPYPSEASWGDSPRSRVNGGGNTPGGFLQSSPLRRTTRIASPESPTPANLSSSKRLQMLLPTTERDNQDNVEIYVDPSADEDDAPQESKGRCADPNSSISTDMTNSFSSDLSDPEYDDDENDPNEENDPIVHSFGPFGANLSDRLASITASSPKVNRSPNNRGRLPPVRERETSSEFTSENPGAPEEEAPKAPFENPVISNHVVNQLAYSRLSSTPLSAIMQNLPADERGGITKEQLQSLIEGTVCIGVISRQGKDAAGKALESEYYYVPEFDGDADRRAAVVDGLRKPSLRACRKQHKQYYWKRPRTP